MSDDTLSQHIPVPAAAPSSEPVTRRPPQRRAAARSADASENSDDIASLLRLAQDSKVQRAAHEIQAVGVRWNTWGIMASRDDKLSDALSPRYLWNKHADMQPGDTIEIKHPLMKWVVVLDLIRIDAVARGLVCHIRDLHDYTKASVLVAPTLSTAKVDWLGDRGWSIVDGGHVAKDGFPSRESAEAWLNDMLEAA